MRLMRHRLRVLTSPGASRARRGVTMADVAVAAVLLAIVITLAMRIVLSLSDSAEESLLRANARRQVLMTKTALENDLGAAMSCTGSRLGPVFAAVNADADASSSFSLYADADADGDADLVGWRLADNRIERAVKVNTSSCSTLTLTDADWALMAAPATVHPDATVAFAPQIDGASSQFAGTCASTPLACRFDAIRVRVTLEPPKAGRVDIDVLYGLPDSISSL